MNIQLLYAVIRGIDPDKRKEYLLTQGYTEDESEDLIADYEANLPKYKKREKDNVFSQSETFKQIKDRAKKLQERKNGHPL